MTDDPRELKELAKSYQECAEDREGFSEMRVVSIDANHQHAIDRMKKYSEECEEKLS